VDCITLYDKQEEEMILVERHIIKKYHQHWQDIDKLSFLLNADCNGSANIITKAFSNAFANGIGSVAVKPIKVLP
jgi:hypothetical protein